MAKERITGTSRPIKVEEEGAVALQTVPKAGTKVRRMTKVWRTRVTKRPPSTKIRKGTRKSVVTAVEGPTIGEIVEAYIDHLRPCLKGGILTDQRTLWKDIARSLQFEEGNTRLLKSAVQEKSRYKISVRVMRMHSGTFTWDKSNGLITGAVTTDPRNRGIHGFDGEASAESTEWTSFALSTAIPRNDCPAFGD